MILCYKALAKKNGISLCISVNSRSASEIIRKCVQFAESIKLLSHGKIDYTASYDSIKFSNGSRVLSLPSTADSLRGFTSTCTVIDEAAYIQHLDDIMAAIGPTLTRDPEAELIFTTTPAGKIGPFYQLYQESLDNDDWYVQLTTINQAITDGLRVNLESLHTLCPDNDIFKQEYECVFSNEFGAMIDVEQLDWYENDVKADGVYFSADIGRTHDKTSIVITKTLKDDIFVDDVIMLSKCDYKSQLDIFKQLNDKWHFFGGYIDSGGIGSAVAEFANKQISVKIKPMAFTAVNKTPMYEAVRDKIFQRKLHFNKKFKTIIEQDFRNVSRIVNEAGNVKFVAGSNDEGHSDFVSSLVLNIQAIKDNPVNFEGPDPGYFPSRLGPRAFRLC